MSTPDAAGDGANASPAAFDSTTFRSVLGQFPTGVTVVTAYHDGSPAGLVVGSFFSVSLEPPLVGFCVGRRSSTWPKIEAAGHFCVNVLGDDQVEVANRFATSGADKFAGIGWRPAVFTGAPMLDGCLAVIDCEVHEVVEEGDHWVVIGHVRALEALRPEAGPLLFFRGRYGRHEPVG